MRKIKNLRTVIVLLTLTVCSTITITAQQKETYFMKNGNVIFSSPISDIDSIIFYNPFKTLLKSSITKREDGFSRDGNYSTMAGAVTTLCGRTGTSVFTAGAFSVATFNIPKHLVCDADGNILLSHEGGPLMALIDLNTQTVKKVCDFGNAPNSPSVDATGKIILVPSNGTPDGYWKLEPSNGWDGGTMKTFLHPTAIEIANGIQDFTVMQYKHSFALCTIDGKMYLRGNQDGAIIRFDPVTGKGERALNDAGQVLWLIRNPDPGPGKPLNVDAYLVFDPKHPHILYGALTGRHCIAYLNIKTGDNGILAGSDGNGGWQDGSLTAARFRNPRQMIVDNEGNLLIAEAGNNCIRKINLTSKTVSTVAGAPLQEAGHKDGPANIARFSSPWGVCVAKDGAIYVADRENKCIRKIWPASPMMAPVEKSSVQRVANDNWEASDKVGMYMKKAGMDITASGAVLNEAPNVLMSVKDNMLTANPPTYYPEDGNVDFVAYYPHTGTVGSDYTITVNIANQTGGLPEMLYSNNAVNKSPSFDVVPLVFRYSLTKLTVKIKGALLKASDYAAITVSIEGLNTQAKWQLKDGTFTGYSGIQPIKFYKTNTTATEATFEALVLPANIPAGGAEFVINVGNDICRFPAEGNYVAGKQHKFNYTLNVKAPAVKGITFSNPSPVIKLSNINYFMIPNIQPADAFDTNVTWASSNLGVAQIDANGRIIPKATGGTTITATTADGGYTATGLLTVNNTNTRYTNPVIHNVADPHALLAQDGKFYLVGTESRIYRSTDLVNWVSVGWPFVSRPTWVSGGGIWAPELNYVNGKYLYYYTMSTWGGPDDGCIGVAVSDKPEGPYTDKGILINNTIGVNNCIDQTYIEDGGKKYLFWGSWHGIWGVELSNDGLSLKDGSPEAAKATKRQIAGTAYEGAYIHKRGAYYYLFASTGSCCNDLASTYTTVVGRSTSLFGTYTDKQGRRMLDNYHEVLISRNSVFVGPGHNSPLIKDKDGNDWILYHGYCIYNNTGRDTFLDKIEWINDWPVVVGGVPSIEADVPVF